MTFLEGMYQQAKAPYTPPVDTSLDIPMMKTKTRPAKNPGLIGRYGR